MKRAAEVMASRTAKERVAVAFDVESREKALELRDTLGDALGLAKIGSALFVREGMSLVRSLKEGGVSVFLDLKFHDIPSVVAQAVEKAVAERVDYLTVHASGGASMIRAAVDATGGSDTKVLAVTVLTSLALEDWNAGASPAEKSVEAAVQRLAHLATDAGAHGLVGSSRETAILREVAGAQGVVVTPGIRMPGTEAPDQSRTVSVEDAARSGADILVLGRGITRASDPRAALESVQVALEEANR